MTATAPPTRRTHTKSPAERSGSSVCGSMSCRAEAVSTVPGYPDPIPACFTHEREYADRYGPEGIRTVADGYLALAREIVRDRSRLDPEHRPLQLTAKGTAAS